MVTCGLNNNLLEFEQNFSWNPLMRSQFVYSSVFPTESEKKTPPNADCELKFWDPFFFFYFNHNLSLFFMRLWKYFKKFYLNNFKITSRFLYFSYSTMLKRKTDSDVGKTLKLNFRNNFFHEKMKKIFRKVKVY